MTREDIGCIIKWFSHIEQLATDGKTANGFQMPTDKLLATIKVVAKDSREYVEKFCKEFVPNDLEEAAKKYAKAYTDNDNGNGGDDWEDDIRITFQAGAKWQKEQMMKEAVEGKIIFLLNGDVAINIGDTDEYKLGKKVCVIVLPKEDSNE